MDEFVYWQLRRQRADCTPTTRRGKTGYAVEESVRGSVSVDALQKLEYCCRREDRLRRRRERERKRRAPETGGTLEKAMELVQSHSQRILNMSYSSSPACIHTPTVHVQSLYMYCWGALRSAHVNRTELHVHLVNPLCIVVGSPPSAFTTIARSMNTTNSSSTAHSASQLNKEDRLQRRRGPVTEKAKRAKHSQSWHQARGPTGITLQVQCWSARQSLLCSTSSLNKWAAEKSYCC